MTKFPAYANNFELHPKDGEAAKHLASLVNGLARIDFTFTVANPNVNSGQAPSDFDDALMARLHMLNATPFNLVLPAGIPQKFDFAFKFDGRSVVVESEKTNREKILRDILKCHVYLHSGADYAVLVLPRNYPHKHGIWNLFEFGVERYDECRTYGFGSPDKFERIALLGFDQYEAVTNRPLTKAIREQWRVKAAASLKAS